MVSAAGHDPNMNIPQGVLDLWYDLQSCHCCDRHLTNRPQSLNQGWTESLWQNTCVGCDDDHECDCDCRHQLRFLCRQVQGGFIGNNGADNLLILAETCLTYEQACEEAETEICAGLKKEQQEICEILTQMKHEPPA